MSSVIDDLENFAVLKIFQWHLKVTKLIVVSGCHSSPKLSEVSGEHFASIQLWFSRVLCSATWLAFLPLSPPGWRGIVIIRSWSGRLLDLRDPYLCNRLTDFLRSKFCELSRPVIVHCHGHLPICPIWACPWTKDLSNLAQIGSRHCGKLISGTAGWI